MLVAQSIVGFPFRSIVRNALRVVPPVRACLWAGENEVFAKFSNGSSYHSEAAFVPSGAPLLMKPPCRSSAFAQEVLRPNRMACDGDFVFVVDHPESVLALIQTRNLPASSNAELSKLPVETLMPSVDLPPGFCWEILSSDFKAIPESGSVPATVVLVGLPQNVCWWTESWAESVDGMLRCVWPSPLAILHWCRRFARSFALIPGKVQSYLALFDGGHLRLIIKLPSVDDLGGSMLHDLVEQVSAELHLRSSAIYIYPGELPHGEVWDIACLRNGQGEEAGVDSAWGGEPSKARAAVLEHLLSIRSL